MATVISYIDQYDKLVSEAEVSLLNGYTKVVTIDGKVRQKEHYSERGMYRIDHYLRDDEIAEDIISKYNSINLDTVEVTEEIGSYKVLLLRSYAKGSFRSATKMFENVEGNETF